jgi:hypothetical protein
VARPVVAIVVEADRRVAFQGARRVEAVSKGCFEWKKSRKNWRSPSNKRWISARSPSECEIPSAEVEDREDRVDAQKVDAQKVDAQKVDGRQGVALVSHQTR